MVESDIEMHTIPPTQNSSFIPSSMLADNVRTSHEAQVNDYRPRNIGYSSRPPSCLSSRPPSRFSSVEPVSPSERHSSLPPTRRFRPSVSSRVIGPSLVAIEVCMLYNVSDFWLNSHLRRPKKKGESIPMQICIRTSTQTLKITVV